MKRKKIIKKIADFSKNNDHLIAYYPFALNSKEVKYVYNKVMK